jgi:hypothetical protein
MANSSHKCRNFVAGLAGGIRAESHIETVTGDCMLGVGEYAKHVVNIQNKTFLPYEITVSSECESAHLRYGNDKTWTQQVQVPAGKDRLLLAELDSVKAFVDQGVNMTVSYTAIGCRGTGAATMQLLLDAKAGS